MTDTTTTNFDPITRLQQIAAIIKESGADIFYAPTTVAYDIECAIKEIERLRRDYSCICNEMRRMMEERDEARRLYCIAFQEITENLGEKNTTESIAEEMGWDCFKENSNETWSAEKHDAIARHIKDTVNEITENTRKAVPQKIDLFKENS